MSTISPFKCSTKPDRWIEGFNDELHTSIGYICPGKNDVLCGRGRIAKSCGNVRFYKIVESNLEDYSNTTTKEEKSYIICKVVSSVRSSSPPGRFLKRSTDTKRWYDVGDFLAREKTSQAFRDCLHDQYKSSNESKKKYRKGIREMRSKAVKPSGKAQLISTPFSNPCQHQDTDLSPAPACPNTADHKHIFQNKVLMSLMETDYSQFTSETTDTSISKFDWRSSNCPEQKDDQLFVHLFTSKNDFSQSTSQSNSESFDHSELNSRLSTEMKQNEFHEEESLIEELLFALGDSSQEGDPFTPSPLP